MVRKFIVFGLIVSLLVSCTGHHDRKGIIIKALDKNWDFRQHDQPDLFPAKVPGSVHTDLMANKLIGDPYYRLNEKDLQWIDKKNWDYRTIIYADDKILSRDRVELVFEGIDTYSTIMLNGEVLLHTDNMFRTYVVDVTGKLKPEDNELWVSLESPTARGLEELKKFGFQLAADNDQSESGEMGSDRVSPYVRKAPYHFGWDWGPRLVTSGIWRPVVLRAWNGARIDNLDIVTVELLKEKADLIVKVEIEVLEGGEYKMKISGDSSPRAGVPFEASGTWNLEPGTNSMEVSLSINDPKLWQPNGLGDPNLYNFKVELLKENEVIDSKEIKTGLRTARLVKDPDPDGKGKSFYFEVNGKPVFAKGANYIPNDIFLNRVTPGQYEFIIRSAADAHMNMLRVWGGGIYENDIFYDLCDKYGIMVWQDFMFACAMYPGNDEFLENVRLEAIENVKRLRNHPCIVLWCGNNEIEAAWGPYDEKRGWGWKQRYTAEQREIIWKAYDTLFHKILPNVIQEEDPDRPYWHSSPSAGMGQLASYETTSGDMHYWGVWQGQPVSDFRKYRARFMSEYGFQSFPEFNSVKKYTVSEDYNIESEVMMSHQRSGIGNLRIRQYMAEDYEVPVDFEQFLYVGQLLQAEAIKLAIESHRAGMPYCMGSLYWQINDCWPVASWSSIDYYGKWKALQYFAKEAFKPIVLMSSEDNGMVMINLVSDQPDLDKLKLAVTLKDFSGKVLWKVENNEGFSGFIGFRLNEILVNVDPSSVVLVSEIINGDKIIDRDLHYFVKPKDLKLTDPGIKTEIVEKVDIIEVSLTSAGLAKNVFLYSDNLEEQFSDNFFDILPGETVLVTIPKTESTLKQVNSLKMVHLFMTEN
jgi:beta-mannosidase